MIVREKQLGALVSVHGIAPVFLQRAAIIAIASFIFFVAMLIGFSIRKNVGYFLLATAFLIVQLFTLFGFFAARRAVFKKYENGFTYKKHVCLWNEIESIDIKAESRLIGGSKVTCKITTLNGEKIVLTEAIQGIKEIMEKISEEIAK